MSSSTIFEYETRDAVFEVFTTNPDKGIGVDIDSRWGYFQLFLHRDSARDLAKALLEVTGGQSE